MSIYIVLKNHQLKGQKHCRWTDMAMLPNSLDTTVAEPARTDASACVNRRRRAPKLKLLGEEAATSRSTIHGTRREPSWNSKPIHENGPSAGLIKRPLLAIAEPPKRQNRSRWDRKEKKDCEIPTNV